MIYNNTMTFYEQLWTQFFSIGNAFPRTMANFWSAYDLWDYASYKYTHDNDTRSIISADDLSLMGQLASTLERDLNGNLSSSGLMQGDMIRAIAGRTLATRVVALLKGNIASGGSLNKLNLMFGSYEPFVAFFALSRLVDGPSSDTFMKSLPNPGAAMMFELFSMGGNASLYPDPQDLWVRFLYRNGTDPNAPFVQYSLFGNPNSQSNMQYNDFLGLMSGICIGSLANWCYTCQSVDLFCFGLQPTAPSNSTGAQATGLSSQVTPVVGGILGAVLTIFVFGVGMIANRLYRGNAKGSSTLGGFKGAKMASDADIAYANGGKRHERVGSWELRGGGEGGPGVGSTDASSTVKEIEDGISPVTVSGAVVVKTSNDFGRKRIDDDAMRDIGQHPVVPREEV